MGKILKEVKRRGLGPVVRTAIKEHNKKAEAERERKEEARKAVEKTKAEVYPGALRREARLQARRKARAELRKPEGKLVGARAEVKDVRNRGATKVTRAASNAARSFAVEKEEANPWLLPIEEASKTGISPWDVSFSMDGLQRGKAPVLDGPLFDLGGAQGAASKNQKPGLINFTDFPYGF
jgi:hypothetical protein